DGPTHLGDLDGVGHAGDDVVTVGTEEHLGLVLETAEGLGMDDPVTVPFEGGAELVWLLLHGPASGPVGLGGQLGQQVVLESLAFGACSTDERRHLRVESGAERAGTPMWQCPLPPEPACRSSARCRPA